MSVSVTCERCGTVFMAQPAGSETTVSCPVCLGAVSVPETPAIETAFTAEPTWHQRHAPVSIERPAEPTAQLSEYRVPSQMVQLGFVLLIVGVGLAVGARVYSRTLDQWDAQDAQFQQAADRLERLLNPHGQPRVGLKFHTDGKNSRVPVYLLQVGSAACLVLGGICIARGQGRKPPTVERIGREESPSQP